MDWVLLYRTTRPLIIDQLGVEDVKELDRAYLSADPGQ